MTFIACRRHQSFWKSFQFQVFVQFWLSSELKIVKDYVRWKPALEPNMVHFKVLELLNRDKVWPEVYYLMKKPRGCCGGKSQHLSEHLWLFWKLIHNDMNLQNNRRCSERCFRRCFFKGTKEICEKRLGCCGGLF